jgi:magnesium chelatase family protein
MRLIVSRLTPTALMADRGEASAEVRKRVLEARERQVHRGGLNRDLVRDCLDELPVDKSAERALMRIADDKGMTARGWDRVRKVARTIADLEGADTAVGEHVLEAVELRGEWE